ncbi:MAG TPA: hypothetical protein VK493_13280 [Bryobacteraceae bacterium]|nr:hypothetical protein [Bryobacteraceae bacterium]
MFRSKLLLSLAALAASLPVTAATVNVNLSGAVTGTTITAPGASFAQRFAGQTVSGTGITGSPTSPLALQAAGTLEVAAFDPGVSPASNSILSQPGNQGPLSMLLDSNADSITFTSGSADGGDPISLRFFDANGTLVDSFSQVLTPNYAVYSFSSLPVFRGLTIFDDNDNAGLRFQNISYNTVVGAATPEPAYLPAVGLLLIGLRFLRRKR